MKKIIISDQTELTICNLYKTQKTAKFISKQLNINPTIISRVLNKNNITVLSAKNKQSIIEQNIKEIKNFYLKTTLKETAKKYKCSKKFIRNLIKKHNIKRPVHIIDNKLVIELYNQKQSVMTIAKKLGCSHPHICNILRRNNIPIKKHKEFRKYILHDNFFEKIDSHEKAAILGFLFADGYNNEKEGKVKIGIHKKDMDYLNKINFYIQPDKEKSISFSYSPKFKNKNLINKKDKSIACLSIYSKQMSVDLSKLGCRQAKSLTAIFPKIDDEFLCSFVLGYFDGDGSISFFQKSFKNKRQYMINLCVSDCFGLSAKQIIENILNIHTCLIKKGKISSLSISGNLQVEKFLNWIYSKSSVYLNRKYKIYTEMKEYFQKYNQEKFN